MSLTISRMKAVKLTSTGKTSYAMHNIGRDKAIGYQHHGKLAYSLSDVGAGIYPLCIQSRFPHISHLMMDLSSEPTLLFRISGSKSSMDDVLFNSYKDRQLSGFTIWVKLAYMRDTDKAVEIHNGGLEVFKNIVGAAAGVTPGGGFASETGKGGLVPSVAHLVSKVAPTAPSLHDTRNAVSRKKDKPGGHPRIILSLLPLQGSVDSGEKKLTAQEVATVVATHFL